MTPDGLQGWSGFLVAETGAAAALAGQLFVAGSIIPARILKFPQLPVQVAETLLVPPSVLVVATLVLVPGQSAGPGVPKSVRRAWGSGRRRR